MIKDLDAPFRINCNSINPLGCYGDGGALFTDDDQLADIKCVIRTHGGVKRHYHTHVGMNGRFDSMQAAVLLSKLTGLQVSTC